MEENQVPDTEQNRIAERNRREQSRTPPSSHHSAVVAANLGRLEKLPFPYCWQMVCDSLSSSDILRLSRTSHDHLRLISPMLRELTFHHHPPPPYENADLPIGFEGILRRCCNIERLNGVNLGCEGAARLGSGLKQCGMIFERLHTLNLSCNMIGESGLSHLVPGLFHAAPNLQALLLDSNSLGNGGIKALAGYLQVGFCPHLKVLNLALNAIGSIGCLELAEAMHDSPHACRWLEVLNLDGNVLGITGTQALAKAFRAGACENLRQLHLRNNDVRGEGLRELLAAFCDGACSGLEVFNLDSNMFGCPGARLLADAFNQGACSGLQVLNLNATFIGEAGNRALANAFRAGACKYLQQLYLRSAHASRDNGIHELVTAFHQTGAIGANLQVMVLDLNNILA